MFRREERKKKKKKNGSGKRNWKIWFQKFLKKKWKKKLRNKVHSTARNWIASYPKREERWMTSEDDRAAPRFGSCEKKPFPGARNSDGIRWPNRMGQLQIRFWHVRAASAPLAITRMRAHAPLWKGTCAANAESANTPSPDALTPFSD